MSPAAYQSQGARCGHVSSAWPYVGAAVRPDLACQGTVVLGDVQYPTVWLPVGLIAAVLVGAAVWPGERFTRAVVPSR